MENETTVLEKVNLRTLDGIIDLRERTAARVLNETLEPKAANAIDAHAKGALKIKEMQLKYWTMLVQARMKKVKDVPDLPKGILSDVA